MAGQRKALLVGVAKYLQGSGLASLNAPTRDAEGLAEVLKRPELCRFETKCLQDPESQQLREEVERLYGEAGKEDLVLFYFSGHGKLGETSDLYLCASNFKPESPRATALPLRELRTIINETKAAQVIIVLDCCFSGAARESLKGDSPDPLYSQIGGEGKGKYLITSSSPIEPSREVSGEEFSLFTKWLIQGIENLEGDLSGDGILTVEELAKYANDKVKASGARQTPDARAFDMTPGDVVIARRSGVIGPAAVLSLKGKDLVNFRAVQQLWRQHQVIPFLGLGVYGDGPLGAFGLAKSLGEGEDLTGEPSLASVAEHLQRLYGEDQRAMLLEVFQEVLLQATKQLPPLRVYDLVAEMEPPVLIISATYDTVLEKRLDEAQKTYVIVSHVIHSKNKEKNGQILVVRRGGDQPSAKICAADMVAAELDEKKDRVIYKVMGSPFINEYADEYADPALEIDTVVLTEMDHLTFLGRLEHQHTQVPSAFAIPFKKRNLLFLGYGLHVWQYRLVTRLIPRAVEKMRMERCYAVRQPLTTMEERCWECLGAHLIKSDAEAFAQTLLGK